MAIVREYELHGARIIIDDDCAAPRGSEAEAHWRADMARAIDNIVRRCARAGGLPEDYEKRLARYERGELPD